ncbi:MAG: ABC transporter substrate-binding protein [Candidatus Goldiibacteriota bacterium]
MMRRVKAAAAAAVLFLMFYAWGCAPKAVLKTPDAVVSEKEITVSPEEILQWRKMATEGENAQERAKGAFWAGQYHMNLKETESAIRYFSHNEAYYSDTVWGYVSILRLAEIYEETGSYNKVFEKMKVLLEKRHRFPEYTDNILAKLRDFLKKITADKLKQIYRKDMHPIINEYALYFICIADIKEGNIEDFTAHAKAFLMEYRDSVFYEEISAKFRQAVKYKPVNRHKIAAVFPLSGNASALTKIIKNGFDLALAEYNAGLPEEEKIRVFYIDENLPEKELDEQIVNAIEKENVITFVGPLYSKTVKRIIPILSSYNVALFSPTAAQPGLPKTSDYFFRNCGTAKGQSYAMAGYILENTDIKRIGSIYPDNSLGDTMTRFFEEKFSRGGGEIVRRAAYDPGISDLKEQIILMGGIDAMLLKSKKAEENRAISDLMGKYAERIMQRINAYMNLYRMPGSTGGGKEERVNIALLHFSPFGENIEKHEIDLEMTKRLSYAVAKNDNVRVHKQTVTNRAMENIGVAPADLDRDIALTIAHRTGSDILIWGRIEEEESNTLNANFLPEITFDDEGNTLTGYNFTKDDYHNYSVTITAIAASDEEIIDEIYFNYRKIKEPRINPLELDALYIPAEDKKMVLVKDQLKFYELMLPVFGSTISSGRYLSSFRESVEGFVYPSEFYINDPKETVQLFVSKFREKYAVTPNVIAANSYDLMNIVISIIDRRIESRESFKDILKGVRRYEGVTGMFSFDRYGDSVKNYYIMKIKEEEKFIEKVRGK